MSQYYNQNYTREQIEGILNVIQDCVRKNHYTISKNENRIENIEFIRDYNIKSSIQKDILLRIEPTDFCHTMQNIRIGYEHEILYVFCPQILLYKFDASEELVDIYIKFNIIEYDNGKRVIAISFHKRNKPIAYLFK